MLRTILLRTLSAAAVTAALNPLGAQAAGGARTTTATIINGGGATSPQAEYSAPDNSVGAPVSELSLFNASQTAVQFGTYYGSGSGTGQKAFLLNDLTCDINGASGANGGACTGPVGGPNTVHYGASDNPLSAAQISSWATSSTGQSLAGNLIQLPTVGTGTAVGVVNSAVKKNGQVAFSDNDLCGIFSGAITNFSQITDGGITLTPGPITVVYRTDTNAPTFLLTNHLAQPSVCNSSNTYPGFTFTGTTNFSSLFPNNGKGNITGGPLLATAFAVKLNSGVADYLAGLSNGTVSSAVGVLAPDWTSIVKTSLEVLSNGKAPTVLVAALTGSGTKPYTPTTANILLGLKNPGAGATHVVPPANATDGANPANWIPVIPVTTTGYPIVGYGTLDVAQCYADPAIAPGIIAFLKDHYTNAAYKKIQLNNGVQPLTNTPGARTLTYIEAHILGNAGAKPWNDSIGNATACATHAGR